MGRVPNRLRKPVLRITRPSSDWGILDPLLQVGAGHHQIAAASLALQPNVGSQPGHFPFVAAAGVALLQPHEVAEPEF